MEKIHYETKDIQMLATNFHCFFNGNMRYVMGTVPAEMVIELFDNEEIKHFQFCSVIHPLLYSKEDAVPIGTQYSFFSYYCFFNDKKYDAEIEMLDQEPEYEGDEGIFLYKDDDYSIVLFEHSYSNSEIDMYAYSCNVWFQGLVQKEEFDTIIYLSKDGWKCSLQSCESLGNNEYEVKLKLQDDIKEETVSVFVNKKEHITSSDDLKETVAKDEELAVMFYVAEMLFNE